MINSTTYQQLVSGTVEAATEVKVRNPWQSSEPKLTVLMPAYNEEGAIESAVSEIKDWVLDAIPNSNLLVINDGSKDKTGEILDRIADADRRVAVIHQANSGHGPSIINALDAARGEYVFLIDSDRQIPIEAFGELWKQCEESDGAFGVRKSRKDPAVRRVLTTVVRGALFLMFGVKLHDANVPFKVFRRSIWLEARKFIPSGTLAPSIFLAVFIRKKGFRVAEVEVPHRERETGECSIRKWKLFKFCSRALGQLAGFAWRF